MSHYGTAGPLQQWIRGKAFLFLARVLKPVRASWPGTHKSDKSFTKQLKTLPLFLRVPESLLNPEIATVL